MVFAKDFFDLQFSFAERVRDLSGIPLGIALLEYTNLYARFGLGRDFNVEHESWQTYLAGLRGGRRVLWFPGAHRESPSAAVL